MALGRYQTGIVDRLKNMAFLDEQQYDTILSHSGDLNGEALEKLLTTEYKIAEFPLLVARAQAAGMMPFPASRLRISEDTFALLSREFCIENHVIPVAVIEGMIAIAQGNPFDVTVTAKISELTGRRVVRLLAPETVIHEKLQIGETESGEAFGDVVEAIGEEFGEKPGEIKESDLEDEESAPIIQLVNRIIEDAHRLGCSDIHIEPAEKDLVVRYRIDGVCQEKLRLPRKVSGAVVARLKVMANLDIAERRLPQDGRIVFKQFTKKNIDIDLRVSTAPLNHGEGVVMRILDKQKSTLPLPMLGFSDENLSRYREVIQQPYGMILHCGPTGSGKSMTLYSALNEINSPELVIRTAEDPIEYTLAGINQMQMNRHIGLTFAAALRAYLRQDPDIILVGEIRDKETANIAVEAALTGHLLLSTLHTNDAPGTVARLTDMGIEPFMISSSLLAVCSQRLMRRLCKNCKQPFEPEGRPKKLLEQAIGWSGSIFRPSESGCPSCNGSGYKGRVGIHELMTVSEDLVEGINRGVETAELKRIAMKNGMKTLHQDSLLKVKEGVTSLEEALSTVPPDL